MFDALFVRQNVCSYIETAHTRLTGCVRERVRERESAKSDKKKEKETRAKEKHYTLIHTRAFIINSTSLISQFVRVTCEQRITEFFV